MSPGRVPSRDRIGLSQGLSWQHGQGMCALFLARDRNEGRGEKEMNAKIGHDRSGRSTHAFRFEGGDVLNAMGAVWFVSFAYHEKIDPAHVAWNLLATVDGRKAAYRRSVVYHRFWLYKILQMSNARLDRNHIGLSATDVKQLVHELLDMFW